MDNEQLMRLRRQVRRDGNIACGPARLFSEIIDLHLLEQGCFAEDEQLGVWLNASTRTIRRWRGELEQAGYLRKEKRDGRRHLVPAKSDGQDCRTDVSDKAGQCPDIADKSGQNSPDKSGQHREINMPAERESAPAHGENPVEEGQDQQTSDVTFSDLLGVWRSESSAPPMTEKRMRVLQDWAEDNKIPDLTLFERVLAKNAAQVKDRDVGFDMGVFLEIYRDEYESGKLTPDQQEDDDYTVNENGDVCYKGVPLSQIGPQNLAADIGKDGAQGREPEVGVS